MNLLQRFIRFFTNPSFKVDLLTMFFSLFILSFTSIISYTYYENYQSMMRFSRGTIALVSATILEKLQEIDLDLEQGVQITEALMKDKKSDYLTNPSLISLMLNAIHDDRNINRFYIANNNGNLIESGNLKLFGQTHYFLNPQKKLPTNAKYWLRFVDRSQSIPTDTWIYKDSNLKTITKEVISNTNYDPRGLPWYIAALHANDVVWLDAHNLFETTQQGITVTEAIRNNKQVQGAVGVDVSFLFFNHFLKKQIIGKTGSVYLLDAKGEMMASGKQNFDPALINLAYEQFKTTREPNFVLNVNQNNYLIYANRLTINYGKNWYIIVIAPFSDFFGEMLQTQKEVILMSLFILFITSMIAYYFSKRISDPIVTQAKEIDKITRLKLDSEVRINSHIKEINIMDNSIAALRVAFRSFAKYVPREVIKQLILSGKEIGLGGEKHEITIFFSDIANFTTFSESLDTELLLKSLTEYFDGLSKVILKEEGIIDKYIGDSIMAFWGAPLQKPDHAILACETSLLCVEFIKNFNIKQKEQSKPQFFTRFGINTGNVIVGNIGTLARMNYTAMGDSVNIAARLQSVNKIYDTTIIISEAVYNKICHADFILRPLDIIEVKGKKYKIKIYELRGKINKDSTLTLADDIAFCQLFAKGFELFHSKEYKKAHIIFDELLSTYPNDVPTQLYVERIKLEGSWQIRLP